MARKRTDSKEYGQIMAKSGSITAWRCRLATQTSRFTTVIGEFARSQWTERT